MILIFIITFIVAYTLNFYWKTSKYPKGPTPWPLFGNILQFDPSQMHHEFTKFARDHGKIYTLWILQNPSVVLSEYHIIKEALVQNGDALSDRSSDPPATIFQKTENGGILFSNGPNWKEQRRTAIHILRNFGVGKNVMEAMVHEQTEQFVKNIKENYDYNAIAFKWPIQRFPILLNIPYVKYKAVGRFDERMEKCYEHISKDIEAAVKDYSIEDEPSCMVQAYKQQIPNNELLKSVYFLMLLLNAVKAYDVNKFL